MKLISATFILLFITGCQCIVIRKEAQKHKTKPISQWTVGEFQKLYYTYRKEIVAAIKNNETSKIACITEEYASKTGVKIILVTISQKDDFGKWQVLLHKYSTKMSMKLPKIHYASSKTVHIHKGENYVMFESNKMGTSGQYNDNIYIRLVILK